MLYTKRLNRIIQNVSQRTKLKPDTKKNKKNLILFFFFIVDKYE